MCDLGCSAWWQTGAGISSSDREAGSGIELGCAEGRRKAGGRVVLHIALGRIELALVGLLFLWGQRAA